MAEHLASIFGTGKDRVNCPSPSPATSSPRGRPELCLPRLHRAGGMCRSASWLTVNSTVRCGRSRVKVSDGLGMGIGKTVWVTLRAALVGRDGQQDKAVLAHFMLNERLQRVDLLGCGLCIAELTVIIIRDPE